MYSCVARHQLQNLGSCWPVWSSRLSLFVAGDGVTLCVGVNYEASSPRRIVLRFQEAGFSDVRITPLTEAVIAPALLPRNWVQQQILLAIKEVSWK